MTLERREELLENLSGVLKSLEWQESISTEDFVQEYVYLPKTNAIGAGQKADLKYSSHLKRVFKMYDEVSVGEIWLRFSSQMAKTLALYAIWAKNAKMDAKTCVWMISKEVMIPRYQKEKISDLVNASEEMKQIVEEGLEEQKKSRSKTGIFYHQGAATYLIGSKTSDDKKSVTAKLVLVDEADEMDGLKAIKPLQERTKTFFKYGAKMVVASTRKEKNGAITQGINSCEQKNYLGMYCPHCEELIEIHHNHLIIEELSTWLNRKGYDKNYPKEIIAEEYIPEASKNTYYKCQKCDKKITSEQKDKQVLEDKLEWIIKGKKHKPYSVGFDGNSIVSFFVPFELMAREYLIASLNENEEERNEALKVFYEGYYNDWFDPNKDKISKTDDILLLDSGIPKGEIEKNTAAIYMTIDSQKGHNNPDDDHYWYVVGSFDKDLNWKKIESGKIYNEKKLYTIMCKKYNYEGKEKKIRRVLWDIQGHGEVEVLAFIHKVNKIFGQIYKYEKEERNYLVYPYRGKTEIQAKTYNLKIERKQDTDLIEQSYPLIEGNSKRGKDELFRAIGKTIKYRKGEEVVNPEIRGWYIDETEALAGRQRLQDKLEKGQKIPAEAFEMQITSEVYGVMRNGKEGYETTYDGRPNHYLDCCYMQYIAKDFDGLEERLMER